jgi:RNA-directed DNA polymerase
LVNTDAPWPDLYEAEARVLNIQAKLHRWAVDDPRRRFDDLFNLVADPAFLVVAWDRVRNNKGARSKGVDGVAPRSIVFGKEMFLYGLREDLKARRFVPLPVREKLIPKKGGKFRGLGIPTARDRTVQAALKLVLEPIFEADFMPCSYGFRPRRRAQDAIEEIFFYTTHYYHWVLEGDIKSCFDEIDHTALMGRVRRRVGDKRVLGLVKAFLKAGILGEDQVLRDSVTGTPQGGILSPLLANIALSVLDEHFMGQWESFGGQNGRSKRRRQGLANYRLVRYADDFVVLLTGAKEHVEALREEAAAVLAPMGLRLSEEKTLVTHIDQGFDFLVATRGRTVMSGLADWRVEHVGDSESRVSVRGPVPTLACVAGNGGVRSIRGNAQGRPLHPGATGKGKAGRVNASELSLMPRNRNRRRWDVAPRVGLAAEMRQRRPVTRSRSCEHRRPGVQRAPSPVGSRPCGTWKPPRGPGFGPVSRP